MAGTVPATVNEFTLAVFCTRSTSTEAGNNPIVDLVESRASIGTVGSIGIIGRSVSASPER